jgi:predicted HicB family RNase H-like nuclease
MSYTQAQKKATQKYLKTLKSLSIRISEEDYTKYATAAKNANMSLRAYVIKSIEERMEKGC